MPSLDDLLNQSMLFTATDGGEGLNPLWWPYRTPTPTPKSAADLGHELTADIVRNNDIWQMSWSPAQPGIFRQITLLSRGMGMDYSMPVTAYDRIDFSEVQVVRHGGRTVKLSLDAAHMIGAWEGRAGVIAPFSDLLKGTSSRLWRLDTRIDSSLLVAFGYHLDAAEPRPLTSSECEALGDDLMPPPGTVRPRVEFTARPGASATVRVGYPRYIVVVELVLCRENPDFVPGDMIGFARIHPHAMVWSTEALERIETTILMARPRKAMNHGDPAMHSRHKALLVTDSNETHGGLLAQSGKPIPYADAIYDYYEVDPARNFAKRVPTEWDHPLQRTGEVTLADARFREARSIDDAVARHSPTTTDDRTILKVARQGQFDNVHIAPRMRLAVDIPGDGRGSVLVDDHIAMIFVCLHDCCHMHVRWSGAFSATALMGWGAGAPHATPGAPAVPENQTVFASFPDQHTLRYRAVAESVAAGDLSIFCHHGSAYAVDIWPTTTAALTIFGLQGILGSRAAAFEEPFFNAEANDSWAMFYFRIRYTGEESDTELGWTIRERLSFDLERCMR